MSPGSEVNAPGRRLFAQGDDLGEVIPAWEELVGSALERNPSAEPWMCVPAIRHRIADGDVRLFMVFAPGEAGTSPGEQPSLWGVFPLEVVRKYRGLPVTVLRLWNHGYSLAAIPLLHRDHALDALRTFFAWVREHWSGAALVEFPEVCGEGAFFDALCEVLRADRMSSEVVDAYPRGFYRPRSTADGYLSVVSTAHHRKEFRRQQRRLGELGRLEFRELGTGDDVAAWVEAFLALEGRSWKGREGTAFASKDSHRAYLREIVSGAAERNALMCLGLWFNGEPIALKLNFLCGDGGYTFKIAFDERYAKYSPGSLLELENIRRAHARSDLRWLDSLAKPGHEMIGRLWLDRTTIVTTLVAPGRFAGELLVGAFPLLRAIKRALRRGH